MDNICKFISTQNPHGELHAINFVLEKENENVTKRIYKTKELGITEFFVLQDNADKSA